MKNGSMLRCTVYNDLHCLKVHVEDNLGKLDYELQRDYLHPTYVCANNLSAIVHAQT